MDVKSLREKYTEEELQEGVVVDGVRHSVMPDPHNVIGQFNERARELFVRGDEALENNEKLSELANMFLGDGFEVIPGRTNQKTQHSVRLVKEHPEEPTVDIDITIYDHGYTDWERDSNNIVGDMVIELTVSDIDGYDMPELQKELEQDEACYRKLVTTALGVVLDVLKISPKHLFDNEEIKRHSKWIGEITIPVHITESQN